MARSPQNPIGAEVNGDDNTLAALRSRGPVRGRLALMGPALVAAIAYIDPGNIATNTQAGALTGYSLTWVIVASSLIAMLVQYMSAKLGLATGRSLPEVCRDVFPRRVNVLLWIQAELVAVATDLAEFVGAALGLNLLFGVPLPMAGLFTAAVSLAILAVQRRGQRRFEDVIALFLLLTALGFIYDLAAGGPASWGSVATGLRPTLIDDTAVTLAVGIVGATVMPHAVYLHSALTEHRVAVHGAREMHYLLRYLRLDCLIGLGLASLVNLAMLAFAAELFAGHEGWPDSLPATHELIGWTLGATAATVFAVALLASGIASSSVGTYAGQVVMAGFINRRIRLVARRLITMCPSLVVLGVGLPVTDTLIVSQVALSFGVPFALVPLLIITRRRDLMGPLVNRRITDVLAAISCAVVIVLNGWLLATLG